ncbi:hypothetical protein [Microbacterium sp.]|uniref:hypothetical protein n=1 Tax=Microbacterium sp. TaxID=51671 RepID=UPI003A9392B4
MSRAEAPAEPAAELPARAAIGSAVAVWVVAALMGLAVGVFAPVGQRAGWVSLSLGGCLVLSFAVQLWIGRPHGFIARVALSLLGAFVVLGIIAGVFGLIAVTSS